MSLLRDIPKRVQQEELAVSHWNSFLIRVVRKAVVCQGCEHFLSFSNDEMQRTAWSIMPEKAFHMGTDHSDFRVEHYCVVLCCAVSSGRGEKAVARASLGKEIEILSWHFPSNQSSPQNQEWNTLLLSYFPPTVCEMWKLPTFIQ